MLLTFFKHGSNALLALAILAIPAWALLGGPHLSPLWIVVGALLFYLNEYSVHRFAFHARPAAWAWARRLQRRLHYDHHVEPNRLDLLFLPFWFLGPYLALTAAALALVVAAAAASIMLGVMLATLQYEWMHYIAHIPYQPRTRFGRWMKQYHLRHHFISEKLWFGVSNPSLDWVYRTWREPKDVEKSATVRKLYS